MKFIKLLPYVSTYDGQEHEVALWESDKNECEYNNEDGKCDTSGLYYGTGDSHEPKFCARHFYQSVCKVEQSGCYTLKDNDEEVRCFQCDYEIIEQANIFEGLERSYVCPKCRYEGYIN